MSDPRLIWLRADQTDPGWRLRLQYDPEFHSIRFVEEQVLPERVDSRDARRVIADGGHHTFTPEDLRWLHEAIGELLFALEE